MFADVPRFVVLNTNFDENYTLVSESVEVNTMCDNSSEQTSNLSKNSISEEKNSEKLNRLLPLFVQVVI